VPAARATDAAIAVITVVTGAGGLSTQPDNAGAIDELRLLLRNDLAGWTCAVRAQWRGTCCVDTGLSWGGNIFLMRWRLSMPACSAHRSNPGVFMKHLFAAAALGLACVACQPSAPPPTAAAPSESQAPINPPGAPGAAAPSPTTGEGTQASAPPPGQAAMAEAGDLVPGIPACKTGDNRIPIPVWKPTVDAQNNVNIAPPQQDGQVVVLTLESHDQAKCNDTDPNTFKLANTNGEPGGLEISVLGNSQEVDGVCHLSGLYRNEAGKSTGKDWTTTHFKAVDASGIASANMHCIQSP
jgi:hypothetical protein